MTDTEFTPLFATPEEGEEAWVLLVESKLGTLELPMVMSQVVQEIKDQSEIKANQRKAILRVTQKAIVRAGKMGLTALSDQQIEQYKWNNFIVKVDKAIDGKHGDVRSNPELAEEIARSAALKA